MSDHCKTEVITMDDLLATERKHTDELIEVLEARAGKLMKDRERLDWLSDQHEDKWHDICCWHVVRCNPLKTENVRDAIDAAMAAGKEGGGS